MLIFTAIVWKTCFSIKYLRTLLRLHHTRRQDTCILFVTAVLLTTILFVSCLKQISPPRRFNFRSLATIHLRVHPSRTKKTLFQQDVSLGEHVILFPTGQFVKFRHPSSLANACMSASSTSMSNPQSSVYCLLATFLPDVFVYVCQVFPGLLSCQSLYMSVQHAPRNVVQFMPSTLSHLKLAGPCLFILLSSV
jgi:hypothetical protein